MGIWEKLRLEPDCHRVVALVGAGGKTSTLYALARQAGFECINMDLIAGLPGEDEASF